MRAKNKSKQLEICRVCNLEDCFDCEDSEYVKKIKDSLSDVYNLSPSATASYFSKFPCHTCGDKLAGDRYNCIGIPYSKQNDKLEFAVCVDCFGYLFT